MPEKLKRYYIVKEHPMRIINKCKTHSKGTLASFLVGFCLLYAVVNWVPQVLALYYPATNVDLLIQYSNTDPAELSKLPATPLVVFVYLMLFDGVFRLSECLYALTYIRNRTVDYRALGESLSYYPKAFGLFLVQTLVVSFWTMLFIVPGILAALNFAQSFYIFADDPDKSIPEILTESKMMMYGNRMNYVRLILCYIPYILVAYVPAFLLANLASSATGGKIEVLLISMAADIPMFVVYGLICLGRTVFYELIINKGFADFKYAGQKAFRELEQVEP
jgi:uncharacterized membrane protein